MSVPVSLLAILDQGSCYGYQLRAELDRRTGGLWQVNVGQIYRTLERLERDGDVVRSEPDEQGHVFWTITEHGSTRVRAWWEVPVPRDPVSRDELAMKIAVAASLPGVDAAEIVRAQHAATTAFVQRLSAEPPAAGLDETAALAHDLARDAQLQAAQAQLRWLERTLSRLRRAPAEALALSTEPPRRGRPPASATTREAPAPATDADSVHAHS